jgi:hypothetical protein
MITWCWQPHRWRVKNGLVRAAKSVFFHSSEKYILFMQPEYTPKAKLTTDG